MRPEDPNLEGKMETSARGLVRRSWAGAVPGWGTCAALGVESPKINGD